MGELPSKPRPATHTNEQACIDQHDLCVGLCEGDIELCVQICEAELYECLGHDEAPPDDDGSSCEATDWSCELGDSTDDGSTDAGGFDCSADNYDEGESDGDGEGDDDWGEDWGERSPAGGDGIEALPDLPQ